MLGYYDAVLIAYTFPTNQHLVHPLLTKGWPRPGFFAAVPVHQENVHKKITFDVLTYKNPTTLNTIDFAVDHSIGNRT